MAKKVDFTYQKEKGRRPEEKLQFTVLEGHHLKVGDTLPNKLEPWPHSTDLYETWNNPEQTKEWRYVFSTDF